MHKPTELNLKMLLLAFLTSSIMACGGGDGGSGTGETAGIVDTDGDGLSDDDEINVYGTDPTYADTDGDGLSDGTEVNDRGFNPGVNPYLYNPLVADLPKFEFVITSMPNVFLTYSDTTSTGQELSNTTGNETVTSQMNYKTYDIGYSVEAGYEGGGVVAKATYTQNFGWGWEKTYENHDTWESGVAITNSTETEVTGGGMRVTLTVKNTGHIAYTLNNLTLSAFQTANGAGYDPIGTLSFDGGDFSISPNPNDEVIDLIFSKNDIDVATVMDIWKNSQGLSIRPSAYTVTDQNDTQLSYEIEAVAARSAKIILDFAFNRELEEYWVATDTNPDNPGKSLAEILGDILQVPYVEGAGAGSTTTYQGLTSVRDLEHTGLNGRWLITHIRDTGADVARTVYDIDTQDYSLADINIQRGDEVYISYMQDADGDGLGVRQERMFGTYDVIPPEGANCPNTVPAQAVNPVDSDCDGRSDFDEVNTPWTVAGLDNANNPFSYEVYSNPVAGNIDGDGWNDNDEYVNGTDPTKADTDGDSIPEGNRAGDDPTPRGDISLSASMNARRDDNQFLFSGAINASQGNTLTDLTINWGDSTTPYSLTGIGGVSRQISDLWHDYTADGAYNITVTANDTGGTPLTLTGRIWNREIRTVSDFGRDFGTQFYKHPVDMVDMNNDGRADIVKIGYGGIYWGRAVANGNFHFAATAALNSNWGSSVYAPVNTGLSVQRKPDIKTYFTDLDNDGFTDLLVYERYAVHAFMNQGTNQTDRQLVGPTRVVLDLGPLNGWNTTNEIRQVADVNGDNRPDLVAINDVRGLVVYINNGDTNADGVPDFTKVADQASTFNAGSGYSDRYERVFADINTDGRDDLVGFGQRGVYVMLSQGNGSFAPAMQVLSDGFSNGAGWTSAQHERSLVDVDNDGDLDLVGFGPDGVYVARNTTVNGGTLSFDPAVQVLADFGYTQGYRKSRRLTRYCHSRFLGSCNFWIYPVYYNIHQRMFADVNNDGLPDIVGFGESAVYVALNDGNGAYLNPTAYHTALARQSVEDPDRYSVNRSGSEDFDYYSPHPPRFMADINGDGYMDFVGFTNAGVTAYMAPRILPFQ